MAPKKSTSASASTSKKREASSEAEAKPAKKKPSAKKTTLPASLVGEQLTAITTHTDSEDPYKEGLTFHFDNAEPPYSVETSAKNAKEAWPEETTDDFDWDNSEEEDWLWKLLDSVTPPHDHKAEWARVKSGGKNVKKHIFKDPLVIKSAEMQTEERDLTIPHGATSKTPAKTKSHKVLRLEFEGKPGHVDFFVVKAAYASPVDDMGPGFQEWIVPADLALLRVGERVVAG